VFDGDLIWSFYFVVTAKRLLKRNIYKLDERIYGFMTDLTLIGTNHFDPKGSLNLQKALNEEKPDILSLELPEYAKDFKKNLFEHATSNNLDNFFLKMMGYEKDVVQDYSEKNNVPLFYVDSGDTKSALDEISSDLLHHKQKKINNQNFETEDSIKSKLLDYAIREYENKLSYMIENEDSKMDFFRDCRYLVSGRDSEMASGIKQIFKQNPGKIVHVGGLIHLLDDPKGESLYSRLKYLNPKRKDI